METTMENAIERVKVLYVEYGIMSAEDGRKRKGKRQMRTMEQARGTRGAILDIALAQRAQRKLNRYHCFTEADALPELRKCLAEVTELMLFGADNGAAR